MLPNHVSRADRRVQIYTVCAGKSDAMLEISSEGPIGYCEPGRLRSMSK